MPPHWWVGRWRKPDCRWSPMAHYSRQSRLIALKELASAPTGPATRQATRFVNRYPCAEFRVETDESTLFDKPDCCSGSDPRWMIEREPRSPRPTRERPLAQ